MVLICCGVAVLVDTVNTTGVDWSAPLAENGDAAPSSTFRARSGATDDVTVRSVLWAKFVVPAGQTTGISVRKKNNKQS